MTFIDKRLKLDKSILVATTLPQGLVTAIDNAAGAELISRASWMRRALFAAVHDAGRKTEDRKG